MATLKAQKTEIDDLKKSLDFISDKMETLSKQQNETLILLGELMELKQQNLDKDKKIASLERRLDEIEQYSRVNNVVVSGLKIKPRSYASAVSSSAEPTEEDVETVEQQVIDFLNMKGININSDDIEACHPLPRRATATGVTVATPPGIIVRFVNRKHKAALLKQGRKLKGSNVYINEHLTKKNGEIAKQARFLKRQEKIQGTWSANCKIFIKLNGTPEEAKTLIIRELSELDKYK